MRIHMKAQPLARRAQLALAVINSHIDQRRRASNEWSMASWHLQKDDRAREPQHIPPWYWEDRRCIESLVDLAGAAEFVDMTEKQARVISFWRQHAFAPVPTNAAVLEMADLLKADEPRRARWS